MTRPTLSKLPALTLGLCLHNILKLHCKPFVRMSVLSTEHGITPRNFIPKLPRFILTVKISAKLRLMTLSLIGSLPSCNGVTFIHHLASIAANIGTGS